VFSSVFLPMLGVLAVGQPINLRVYGRGVDDLSVVVDGSFVLYFNCITNSDTQESTGFLYNGSCSVCSLISARNKVLIKYPVIVNNQLHHLNTI
jgi:hypothetical protein